MWHLYEATADDIANLRAARLAEQILRTTIQQPEGQMSTSLKSTHCTKENKKTQENAWAGPERENRSFGCMSFRFTRCRDTVLKSTLGLQGCW